MLSQNTSLSKNPLLKTLSPFHLSIINPKKPIFITFSQNPKKSSIFNTCSQKSEKDIIFNTSSQNSEKNSIFSTFAQNPKKPIFITSSQNPKNPFLVNCSPNPEKSSKFTTFSQNSEKSSIFVTSLQNPEKKSKFITSSQNPEKNSIFISSSNKPEKEEIFTILSKKIRRDIRAFAGRSKKKASSGSGGRIEGNAEVRKEAKRNAQRRGRKLAENLFYRLKNPHRNYPDNFSEDELNMIGLGYDRLVRFMEIDDPNLKHPFDWYKYGEFGPYSWRGVVLGEPVRGRMSDECVTLIGEVKDHEEWEKIESFEMAQDYGFRLKGLDREKGLQFFWVFVRHPKWKVSDKPWEQWTLVCEVALEAGKQRLDKWNLMGRLGNRARGLITQCAAWMRPDVIYVKRPVYQCRFEPQDGFFKALVPLLDPETEGDNLVELEGEFCTYFGGLCRIVKVSPKAFVDDVVKGFEKLSDEKKVECLGFLLANHPVPLLHPYTKEWKVKLEEQELGCDADDNEDNAGDDMEVSDWIEEDDNENEHDDDDEEDNLVVDMEEEEDEDDEDDDELGAADGGEGLSKEESFWEGEFEKALSSNEAMEALAKRSVERTTKVYKEQMEKDENKEMVSSEDGDELEMRGKRAKVSPKEWKIVGYGPYRRRVRKSRIPPGVFLHAAIRPFTYTNLVKEIVLTRHAILDGEIGARK